MGKSMASDGAYRSPWTEREDEILRRNYGHGAEAVARLLHGRTRWAVQQRANRLGLAQAMTPTVAIEPQKQVDLQWLYLAGWPVAAAAKKVGIHQLHRAHAIIDALKGDLRRQGKPLPQRLPRAERQTLSDAIPLIDEVADQAPASPSVAPPPPPSAEVPAAKPMKPASELAVVSAKPQPVRRPLPLDEQIARIAAGAKLVRTFRPTRPLIDATLAGVSSGLL